GFAVGSRLPAHFQQGAAAAGATVGPQNFLLAVIAGLFAFGGWHIVTYVALNAVYFYVLPLDRVMHSSRIAADVATTLLGAPGGAAISALVMFSVFGAMTGSIMAAPRVYF